MNSNKRPKHEKPHELDYSFLVNIEKTLKDLARTNALATSVEKSLRHPARRFRGHFNKQLNVQEIASFVALHPSEHSLQLIDGKQVSTFLFNSLDEFTCAFSDPQFSIRRMAGGRRNHGFGRLERRDQLTLFNFAPGSLRNISLENPERLVNFLETATSEPNIQIYALKKHEGLKNSRVHLEINKDVNLEFLRAISDSGIYFQDMLATLVLEGF